jgi:hypothetical protein
MDYLLAGLFCVALVPLTQGAWLMLQDSQLKHELRKELKQKYPYLTRDELRELTYKRMNELNE